MRWIAILLVSLMLCGPVWAAKEKMPHEKKLSRKDAKARDIHEEYIAFLEEVYDTIDKNYYYPIDREKFEKFIKKFDQDIYSRIIDKSEKSNYVLWRSSALLVDYLKVPEDIFSAFIPPKPAKKFEAKVLGHRLDLGIEGTLGREGFLITRIEPRSDSYIQGLREGDLILAIDGQKVERFTQKEVEEKLVPLIDTTVKLTYFDQRSQEQKTVGVVSKEYFKQSVFLTPVPFPGVYCLEIRTFNRKTSDDLFRFLSMIKRHGPASLILDLRGNPGGPPLAAREISAFFLNPAEEFAYFQKRDQPKSMLDVPKLPSEYHFDGDIAILVDKESGSASELFSGVMQKKGRAVLFGTHTAGQVFLKSMFHFKDESMLILVTGRGFLPDGEVFAYNGVKPNYMVDKTGKDLLYSVAQYMSAKKKL